MLPTELIPGVILHDAYRIIRKLAEGGMGCIYEARHIHLERRYALKQTFFPDAAPALREGFRREAALLANLEHPSLPKVHHFFSEQHNQYVVMDFIAGNSLKQILETRHCLPPWQVLLIAVGVLDVLLYLHTQSPSIVHRDIKPDNIKVHGGRVYLLDFGLAKDMLRGTQIHGYSKGYSSPEQQMGEPTDVRSDIYSLGATMYHILTGMQPSDALLRIRAGTGLDPLDLLLNRDEWIERYDPAASDQLGSKESPAGNAFNMYRIHFAYVIDRALELDPDNRFQSAEEMLKALAVVMHFEMEFLKTLRTSRRPLRADLADLES